MENLLELFATWPWGIYAVLVIGPFVQEDAAVIFAATASVTGLGEPLLLFLSIFAGLSLSDGWKYWAGRAARSQSWARRFAERPAVLRARDKVMQHLGASVLMVRFVPGTRIPFYLASGYFRAPYVKYQVFMLLAAASYIGAIFAIMHLLGEIAGERARVWLPVFALVLFIGVIAAQVWRARKEAAADKGVTGP